jgi:hypothetical protein
MATSYSANKVPQVVYYYFQEEKSKQHESKEIAKNPANLRNLNRANKRATTKKKKKTLTHTQI